MRILLLVKYSEGSLFITILKTLSTDAPLLREWKKNNKEKGS